MNAQTKKSGQLALQSKKPATLPEIPMHLKASLLAPSIEPHIVAYWPRKHKELDSVEETAGVAKEKAMLAPDTCAGLLVSGLQNLPLFFDSKGGRIILVAFPVIRFVRALALANGIAGSSGICDRHRDSVCRHLVSPVETGGQSLTTQPCRCACSPSVETTTRRSQLQREPREAERSWRGDSPPMCWGTRVI